VTGRQFIVDFKTQNCKGKPTYYPECKWQLAAYQHWLGEADCLSVVIDTAEPAVYEKQYKAVDMDESFAVFYSVLAAWYAIKGL
jgi:hypothetical protein